MSEEQGARSEEREANSPEGTASHSARLRWGIYLLLIAVAVGNMTGRLISVNSVDKVQLEANRLRERVERDRQRLIEEGVTGDALEKRMATEKAREEREFKLQRPFLSANDRSRWMTIRSLVEYGKYEIDDIRGQPNWDSIDEVKHMGRDGQMHFYSSKPPLLATLIAGEYPPLTGEYNLTSKFPAGSDRRIAPPIGFPAVGSATSRSSARYIT